MTHPLALIWHRRDLRVHDNPALALAVAEVGTVLGVFVIDPEILGWEDTAPARVHFLRESVLELQRTYAALGGHLVIRRGQPSEWLPALARETGATAVYFNDDIEPYARERDAAVSERLAALGVRAVACPEIMLHDPEEVLTGEGRFYTVYTPFWKRWSVKPKPRPAPVPERLISPDLASDPFPDPAELGRPFRGQLLVTPGEKAGRALLDRFCLAHLYTYDDRRNHPADEDGTSLLSAHLKFGTVGIREVWQRSVDSWKLAQTGQQRANLAVWQQELGWREFYKYVMYHIPDLWRRPFRREFDHFRWDRDVERFERWCRGETGYPIVDAAMRQLNTYSWMHNRTRMIVASFLTKDLLIDYRWGERYFMQKLVDGDLSANNGGWQWAASVGTDPKPLRIFNPDTQASRYDPDARYIRRHLPELADVDAKLLVDSAKRFGPLLRARSGYPEPIVDHAEASREFKQRYREVRGGAEVEAALSPE